MSFVRKSREALNAAGLDFLELFPESINRFDVAPEPPLLTLGHLERPETAAHPSESAWPARPRSVRRWPGAWLERKAEHRVAEQRLRVPDQLGFHVGEHAVEIASET